MKWHLNELNDITSIDETIDYKQHVEAVIDLISIEPTKVTGTLIKENERVIANLNISTNLTQACAITLKPVKYDLEFDATIIFGNDLEADYQLTNPLDLTNIVFGYIIAEKPYVIYHKDAKIEEEKEEHKPHPAFADLDKL